VAASPDELDKRLSIHEAVCAERYETLIGRLGRIEKIMLAVSGTLIAAMAALVVKLLTAVGRGSGL
jgi:hypothetical protein